MVLTIIIAFISLIGLMVLHEFGHFIVAKKFGVKVEEFGIGYPPRIFGKKIGETVYSLNWLPFGAFVRIPGEIEHLEDSNSFSQKTIGQRVLIVLAGVLSFWIMAVILLSIVMAIGAPTAISDDEDGNLINPKVQIAGIAADSPAEKAGLQPGDAVQEFKIQNSTFKINKVKELQGLTNQYRGEEIALTIERGRKTFTTSLMLRALPPSGEGVMGVALVRTAIKSYPWFQAPVQGVLATFNLTRAILEGYVQAISKTVKGLPSGVQLTGPVGVFHLFTQASQLGTVYFLQFIGMIAIYFAIFNILPIPAVDGGKLLFLIIEAIRKKPVSEKVEQKITTFCFSLLIILMIFVTVKDVMRIF